MNKNVFIIIVSFNGQQWLHRNLTSLQQSIYPIKIIVVDNCSSDESISILESFPKVQLILSNENLGFGKANNLGINSALKQQADYVFLLNQDTWIYPETVGNLIKVAESNQEVGIVSPMHFSSIETVLDENFETYWKRKVKSISEDIDEVPFINAAAWLIPKRIIIKVGYFEPMFKHYGEDRNYINRVLFHQFKVVVVKNSRICHDRVIVRNFNKDVVQCKFKILNEVLNINDNLFIDYYKGLRSVFGLPKYFFKFYPFQKVVILFCKLLWYYFGLMISIFKIHKIRVSYK